MTDINNINDINDIEDQVKIFRPIYGPSSPTASNIHSFNEHDSANPFNSSHIVQHHHYNNQPEDTIYASVSEHSSLMGRFPYSLVMKVSASEPRDVLQSERTCLTFIRFSTALFFTALGIILNFKLDTSGVEETDPNPHHGGFDASTYSMAVSYILLLLSLGTLILSGINYFITIKRYANHKIQTYAFNNFSTVVCITCVIITLMAISISLTIQGYLEQE
ncbi:uncharacterized protein RJT20DRAFT_127860 [Scheffersomyces xylosifermentans]|uniref:uncharacterized protein n=1 Tax=Scheffersomyces xylosifermentans TaxID=1304137 RepID=UPI00315CE6FD